MSSLSFGPALAFKSWYGISDHFQLEETVKNRKRLRIKVYVIIIDPYERHHELLPVEWVYDREKDSWWANP